MRLNTNIDPEKHPIEGYARAAQEKGLTGWFSVPLISHIEGNLWNGGCRQGVELNPDFKYVFSLYPWEQYTIGPNTHRHEVTMYDSQDQHMDGVDQIAEAVVEAVKDGKTLIHCQAGLNRSGLIAARALMMMGRTAGEAIDLLREKRCDMVLCNASFESWLRSHDTSS